MTSIVQFADLVVNYSSEYGKAKSSYSASNLAGPPRIQRYGDFTEAFVLVNPGADAGFWRGGGVPHE